MGIKVITEPIGEPVSRVDCQRHLRLDGAWDSPPFNHPEDGMILEWLAAAREGAEAFTQLTLAPKTLELALDRFPCSEISAIELTRGPVQSVVSVKYIDAAGINQTIDPADYVLDEYSDAYWLLPADGFDWPSTEAFIDAVKIRYVAGYSLPGDSPQIHRLPKSIRSALLIFLEYLHKNRGGGDMPQAVQDMLWPHRVGLGV